jgi:CheY-like chemotaxis protein
MNSADLESRRVLVVEDEVLIRWSIAETLTSAGCVVTEVGDAAGALHAVATGDFDAVVLELSPARFESFEAARSIVRSASRP